MGADGKVLNAKGAKDATHLSNILSLVSRRMLSAGLQAKSRAAAGTGFRLKTINPEPQGVLGTGRPTKKTTAAERFGSFPTDSQWFEVGQT